MGGLKCSTQRYGDRNLNSLLLDQCLHKTCSLDSKSKLQQSTRHKHNGWLVTYISTLCWNRYTFIQQYQWQSLKVSTGWMLYTLILKGFMQWEVGYIHAFHTIVCVWLGDAQTPCTIKSNTFNHRMLKPKGKDKIRNVTGTGRTMNWQCAGWKSPLKHNLMYL